MEDEPIEVTLADITPGMVCSVISGCIIIGKMPMENYAGQKYQLTFIIRDSPDDIVKICVWGSKDIVKAAEDKFHVGDSINIINPLVGRPIINTKKYPLGYEEPDYIGPYYIYVYEQISRMEIDYLKDPEILKILLGAPVRPVDSAWTIDDIFENSRYIHGDAVDLLVAVRHIDPVIVCNKTKAICRYIHLFDHSHMVLQLLLTEKDYLRRSDHWKPRETILHVTDMQIESLKGFALRFTPDTIVTVDPVVDDAELLRVFAKSAPALHHNPAHIAVHPGFGMPVMTSERVLAIGLMKMTPNRNRDSTGAIIHTPTDEQFKAVIFGFITKLDLNGLSPVVVHRCTVCDRRVVEDEILFCSNEYCKVYRGNVPGNTYLAFNIFVSFADHTGPLPRLHLSGKNAERILGYTPLQWINLSHEKKTEVKWNYLFQRCEVRILVQKRMHRLPLMMIMSLRKVTINESIANTPVY